MKLTVIVSPQKSGINKQKEEEKKAPIYKGVVHQGKILTYISKLETRIIDLEPSQYYWEANCYELGTRTHLVNQHILCNDLYKPHYFPYPESQPVEGKLIERDGNEYFYITKVLEYERPIKAKKSEKITALEEFRIDTMSDTSEG